MKLRAELYFDTDAGNWHFRVPAIGIVGGGVATRRQAERQCLSAIEFALDGDLAEVDTHLTTVTVPA